MVNSVILDLLDKVLGLQDYGTIVDELKDPVNDVDLLIEFVLFVRLPLIYLPDIVAYYLQALRSDTLLRSSIPDANRRARRLMFKLINQTDVSLKFLLITDVRIEPYHDAVGMGPFGRVYRGDHHGQQVALKVLDKEVGIAIFSLPRSQI